jgi:hypothetical protein
MSEVIDRLFLYYPPRPLKSGAHWQAAWVPCQTEQQSRSERLPNAHLVDQWHELSSIGEQRAHAERVCARREARKASAA